MKYELIKGCQYTCKVLAIEENYDHFPKGNPTNYCHRFLLQYEFDEYDCQICTKSTVQTFCNIGDMVDIRISTFTKNQYTLSEIVMVSPAFPKQENQIPQIPAYSPLSKIKEPGNEPEMAMLIAADFHAKRSQMPFAEVAPDIEKNVIPDAEKILAWIMSKKNVTKQL